MTELLKVSGLRKAFGGIVVADDIDFPLSQGAMHCLIGPNGAGKSSFFRLLLGEHAPDAGEIVFNGQDITKLRSFERIRRCISVKFQVPGIFKALSVRQNLEIAFQSHLQGASLEKTIREMLHFTELTKEAVTPAGVLSHGQQQWLEIAMAGGGARHGLCRTDLQTGDGAAFRLHFRRWHHCRYCRSSGCAGNLSGDSQ